jgi:hypothetical protein
MKKLIFVSIIIIITLNCNSQRLFFLQKKQSNNITYVDIYLAQSNLGQGGTMTGQNYINYWGVHNNVKIWHVQRQEGWETLNVGVNTWVECGTPSNCLPESWGSHAIASKLLADYKHKTQYYIVCGRGSTGLYVQWKKGNFGVQGMYELSMTGIRAALTALINQGYTIRIRAIIWIQGEADTNTVEIANAYDLDTLFNDLTSDLSTFFTSKGLVLNNYKKLIVRLNDNAYGGVPAEAIAIIQGKEEAYCNVVENNAILLNWQSLDYAATHYTVQGLIDGGIDIFNHLKNYL